MEKAVPAREPDGAERPTDRRVVAAWRAGSQRPQQPWLLPSMCTLAQPGAASLPRSWLGRPKPWPLRHIAGTDRTLPLPPSVTTAPLVWELALYRGWKSEQNSSRASIMHIGQIQPPSSTHDFDDELCDMLRWYQQPSLHGSIAPHERVLRGYLALRVHHQDAQGG
jgi:hypothetical protein